MQLIPVLDILNGEVVHAVAGDRSCYRPIQSQLCQGSNPVDVAQGLLEASGSERLYVADLDALSGKPVQQPVIMKLAELGVEIWLDIGLVNVNMARRWERMFFSPENLLRPIIASETLQELDSMSAVADVLGGRQIVLSLDLYKGKLRATSDEIGRLTPLDLAGLALETGVERVIVLELSRVGTLSGLDECKSFCALTEVAANFQLFWGGGIRHVQDVRLANELGYAGVLVATALHRKTISRQEIVTLM